MSNPRARGCLIFLAIVVVAVLFCGVIPFVVMPGAGVGMALPVITVPGEIVSEGALFGVDLTNTLIGTFLSSIVVIAIAALAYRSSRGWTKEVPGRFQALIEVIVEGLYGFLKGLGGERLKTTPMLWPLVGTIFLFLLTANMLKMFPGVETIGKAHCAHAGFSGYPAMPAGGATLLYVNSALDAGTPQTEEDEHACLEYFSGNVARYDATGKTAEQAISELEAQKATLEASLASASAEEAVSIEEKITFVNQQIQSALAIQGLEPYVATLDEQIAALEAAPADDGHADESHAPAAVVEEVVVEEEVTAEGETEVVTEEVVDVEPVAEVVLPATLSGLQTERDNAQTALNLAYSQLQYPGATVALTQDDLAKGAVPYIFHITPFVRGAASDLSLTVAYALMTVILVQVYGVWALGPAYFEKFVNISALGNLGKRPLGAIDFVVGLFEIISEIGKIISLAFRLFGNIFAGGVAMIAISFLVALLVPGVIFLLELVIGAVQALVFSVLTVVFVTGAMEHHGGDHHDDAHAEAGHH